MKQKLWGYKMQHDTNKWKDMDFNQKLARKECELMFYDNELGFISVELTSLN